MPATPSDVRDTSTADSGDFEAAARQLTDVKSQLTQRIFGQDDVIDLVLATLAAGGHGLLIGAPGLAKTLLVTSLADLLGLTSKRVQFTPDLMPGDVIGSEVLEESPTGARAFRFVKGPIFCQLLMADEINRASPRTQSALLQAMQEKHVTVAGDRHDLSPPFHVLATQNPIEQEGTYPLPEAQLDRFLMQIVIDYPDAAAEKQMLAADAGARPLTTTLEAADLLRIQSLSRSMPIAERLVDAILAIVRGARPTSDAPSKIREFVRWGPGPRASQSLVAAAKALALVEGRRAPASDDIARLAKPVLRHRMALTYAALQSNVSIDDLIDELVAEALAA